VAIVEQPAADPPEDAGTGAADVAALGWPAPPPYEVERVHRRYQVEVVEGLNLCPFARRARERGRVHRPLVYAAITADDAAIVQQTAAALEATLSRHPDAEIVLPTLLLPPAHPWRDDPDAFEQLVAGVRAAHARAHPEGPVVFVVGFHPRAGQPTSPLAPGADRPRARGEHVRPEALVPWLRRSPDPLVQAVRIATLEQVRRDAQASARRRMLEEADALDPRLRAIIERSVQADSELSADIARANFSALAHGDGRRELERRLAAIADDRARSYGEAGDAPPSAPSHGAALAPSPSGRAPSAGS
jgi:hypothetical protein